MNEELILSKIGDSPASNSLFEYLQCYGFPQPPKVSYGQLHFHSPEGPCCVRLFGQVWMPENPRALILLVHGYGEHCGNYARLVQEFVSQGYAVTTIDQRGHGLSEGTRGHAPSDNCYFEDLEHWLDIVRSAVPEPLPLFIWGHSMGGMVSLQLTLHSKFKPKAIVCTSPLLGLPPQVGMKRFLLSIVNTLATFFPTLQISSDIPRSHLSDDQSYLAIREEDPLCHRKVTPAWIVVVDKISKGLRKDAKLFEQQVPILMMLAGCEYITNLVDARNFAIEGLSGLKHKVIEFPTQMHELEKGTERKRVVSESIAWFNSHL